MPLEHSELVAGATISELGDGATEAQLLCAPQVVSVRTVHLTLASPVAPWKGLTIEGLQVSTDRVHRCGDTKLHQWRLHNKARRGHMNIPSCSHHSRLPPAVSCPALKRWAWPLTMVANGVIGQGRTYTGVSPYLRSLMMLVTASQLSCCPLAALQTPLWTTASTARPCALFGSPFLGLLSS